MKNRRNILALLLGMVMVMSVLFITFRQYHVQYASRPDFEGLISRSLADWVDVSDQVGARDWGEYAELEYDIIADRVYENNNGERVLIVMTWSREGIRKAGHPQHLCYQSSGYAIQGLHHRTLHMRAGDLTINEFTAGRKQLIEDVAYWRVYDNKLENYSTAPYYLLVHRLQKAVRFLGLFKGHMPDNIMVRVSAVRLQHDMPSTAHVSFLNAFLESLSSEERRLLIGL